MGLLSGFAKINDFGVKVFEGDVAPPIQISMDERRRTGVHRREQAPIATSTQHQQMITQSGVLAVLLQRQRYKISQLAWRRAQRKHMRAALWSTLSWPWRALTAPMPVRHSRRALRRIPPAPILNLLPRPIAMSPPIDTYTELQQQIHDDLRIQHPDWVKPNGKSPMCDSYDACLTEMLGTLTRRRSSESIVPADGALEPAVTGS